MDAVERISRFGGPLSALTAISACEIISQTVIAFWGAGDGSRLLRQLFRWHKIRRSLAPVVERFSWMKSGKFTSSCKARLRILPEGPFERVGEDVTRQVAVRLIAATDRNFKREMEAGRVREDLYYRLSAFPIEIPASPADRGHSVPGRTFPSTSPPTARYAWKLSAEDGKQRERQNILAALKHADWRICVPGDAAELLSLKPTTLTSRMKVMKIKRLSDKRSDVAAIDIFE